jgi:hypothetical protein
LFFSVFNIRNIENKENAKYSTKNNKTEAVPFFFIIKNQTRARTNSSNNLILIATKMCIVWLPGSFFPPLKKI